jgi:hypothetical protein
VDPWVAADFQYFERHRRPYDIAFRCSACHERD